MHLKWDESYVENLAYSPFKKAEQKDTLTQICTWNERMQRNDGKASLVVGDHEAWEWVASEAWKNGQSLNSDIKEYSPGKERYSEFSDHGAWRRELNLKCLVGIRMFLIFSCPTEITREHSLKAEYVSIPREYSLKSEYHTFLENIPWKHPWNWEYRSFPGEHFKET